MYYRYVTERCSGEAYFSWCVCAVYFNNFLCVNTVIEQRLFAVRITIGLQILKMHVMSNSAATKMLYLRHYKAHSFQIW